MYSKIDLYMGLLFIFLWCCCYLFQIRLDRIIELLEKMQKSFKAIEEQELNQGNDEKRL